MYIYVCVYNITEHVCSIVIKLPVIGDCGSLGRLNAPIFYKRDKVLQEVLLLKGSALLA